MTAADRLADAAGIPTAREQGFDLVFANWRGFFAAPGLPDSRYAEMVLTIESVVQTDAFERVRARNGWQTLLQTGPVFYRYLEQQEQDIGTLMREMGYLR